MTFYLLLLAAGMLAFHSFQRKRLRRQMRELNQQTTRLDQFTKETMRLRHQSDRAADLANYPDMTPPTDPTAG